MGLAIWVYESDNLICAEVIGGTRKLIITPKHPAESSLLCLSILLFGIS